MARKSASKVSAATAAAVAAANGAVLAPTFQAAPVAASTHLEAIAKVGGKTAAPVDTGFGTLTATIPAPVATRVAVATGGQGAILAAQVLALLREAGTGLTVPHLAERMGVAPVKVRNGIDALRRTHGKGFVLNTGLATFALAS